ncbi:MAG TPA: cytochrome c oxidase subunit II [bacterium]|nr:cytochrome c oxidase subunit II [bacterium]
MIALLGKLFSSPLVQFAAKGKTFLLPAEKSTLAPGIDTLFYFVCWVSLFFFVLILGLLVFFLTKYRRRPGHEAQETAHHSTPLELVWSGIPLILMMAIFVMGFHGFLDLHTPPDNCYEIQANGQKWSWTFTYPNGYSDSELHAPVDVPVRLTLSSQDVIHSLFVPDFRIKRDVVPGRYSIAWFQATESGESPLYCAEYCGTGHSEMNTKVVIHEPGEFEKWLEKASDFIKTMPPEEAGKLVYQKRGCAQCHSLDGSPGIAPTFKGLFGKQEHLQSGTRTVDENYIRESILQPTAEIVVGFDPVMPTFQGRIKDPEIDVLIAYLKTLK